MSHPHLSSTLRTGASLKSTLFESQTSRIEKEEEWKDDELSDEEIFSGLSSSILSKKWVQGEKRSDEDLKTSVHHSYSTVNVPENHGDDWQCRTESLIEGELGEKENRVQREKKTEVGELMSCQKKRDSFLTDRSISLDQVASTQALTQLDDVNDVRKIPGPAGWLPPIYSNQNNWACLKEKVVVQKEKMLENDDWLLSSVLNREKPFSMSSPTSGSQNTVEDQVDFRQPAWANMLIDLNLPPFVQTEPRKLLSYHLSWVNTIGHQEKVPMLVVLIKLIRMVDDCARVVMRDPSGEYDWNTIHKEVFERYPELVQGSVVQLKDVSVLSPEKHVHYLAVHLDNVVRVWPKTAPMMPRQLSRLSRKVYQYTSIYDVDKLDQPITVRTCQSSQSPNKTQHDRTIAKRPCVTGRILTENSRKFPIKGVQLGLDRSSKSTIGGHANGLNREADGARSVGDGDMKVSVEFGHADAFRCVSVGDGGNVNQDGGGGGGHKGDDDMKPSRSNERASERSGAGLGGRWNKTKKGLNNIIENQIGIKKEPNDRSMDVRRPFDHTAKSSDHIPHLMTSTWRQGANLFDLGQPCPPPLFSLDSNFSPVIVRPPQPKIDETDQQGDLPTQPNSPAPATTIQLPQVDWRPKNPSVIQNRSSAMPIPPTATPSPTPREAITRCKDADTSDPNQIQTKSSRWIVKEPSKTELPTKKSDSDRAPNLLFQSAMSHSTRALNGTVSNFHRRTSHE